ncbi:hypothetical protein HPB52_007189 [Rhipicephalus sanguineus]|uniref:Uncharacterized protein n=1 Tax=Rhipicephalus sanguineus TaxID=34632 RepID=A0A9D4QK78_RHISA|nr:hypothetical protein HPB52_007189 [Rhipicephalus sanguineus]
MDEEGAEQAAAPAALFMKANDQGAVKDDSVSGCPPSAMDNAGVGQAVATSSMHVTRVQMHRQSGQKVAAEDNGRHKGQNGENRQICDQKLCLDHRLVIKAQSLHPLMRTSVLVLQDAADVCGTAAGTVAAFRKALLQTTGAGFSGRVLPPLRVTLKWRDNQCC